MDFSFIITGTISESKENIKEIKRKAVNNIITLKEQLINIGYNPAEVDYMIKTASNGASIKKLELKQLQQIETTLIEQLKIARQCIEFIRDAK